MNVGRSRWDNLTAFSIPSPASNSNCVCSRDLGAEVQNEHDISPSGYLCVTVDPERPTAPAVLSPRVNF